MQNILWFAYYDSITQNVKPINQIMDELIQRKFTGLAYFVGNWKTDGLFKYHSNINTERVEGNKIIEAAHAKGLKVYGSIYAAWWTDICPNLTSATVRNYMASQLVELVNNIPFDGMIDDIEDYQTSPADHAKWTWLMGQKLHGLGKIAAVYYFIQNSPPYIHKTYLPLIDPNLTDFVIIRFHPNSTTTVKNTAVLYNDILTLYPKNARWMAQILLSGGTDYSVPEQLQDSIGFYDSIYGGGFASNFEGFTVWQAWMLYGSELTKWNNWELKDRIISPEPVYCCTKCGLCFVSQALLDEHMLTHVDLDRPSLVARVVANPVVLNCLWVLRQRVFPEAVHRGLHPLI